jgi:hypothetical protein
MLHIPILWNRIPTYPFVVRLPSVQPLPSQSITTLFCRLMSDPHTGGSVRFLITVRLSVEGETAFLQSDPKLETSKLITVFSYQNLRLF